MFFHIFSFFECINLIFSTNLQFIQKKRDVKDIGIAIEILEQIIDGLMKEIEEDKRKIKHSDLDDEIKYYEEKLDESYEIAEHLKEELDNIDKEIEDEQKE